MLTSILSKRILYYVLRSCNVQTTSSRLYVATFAWCCLYITWPDNIIQNSLCYNTGQHHTGAKKAVWSHVLICITIPSGFLDRDCNWAMVLSLSPWVTYLLSIHLYWQFEGRTSNTCLKRPGTHSQTTWSLGTSSADVYIPVFYSRLQKWGRIRVSPEEAGGRWEPMNYIGVALHQLLVMHFQRLP